MPIQFIRTRIQRKRCFDKDIHVAAPLKIVRAVWLHDDRILSF